MSFELTLVMGYCPSIQGLPLLKRNSHGRFEPDGTYRYFEVKAIFELGTPDPKSEFSRGYNFLTTQKCDAMKLPVGWFPIGADESTYRPRIHDKHGRYPELIHATHLMNMIEADTAGPRDLSIAVAALRGAHEMLRNYERWKLLTDFYGILYGH